MSLNCSDSELLTSPTHGEPLILPNTLIMRDKKQQEKLFSSRPGTVGECQRPAWEITFVVVFFISLFTLYTFLTVGHKLVFLLSTL